MTFSCWSAIKHFDIFHFQVDEFKSVSKFKWVVWFSHLVGGRAVGAGFILVDFSWRCNLKIKKMIVVAFEISALCLVVMKRSIQCGSQPQNIVDRKEHLETLFGFWVAFDAQNIFGHTSTRLFSASKLTVKFCIVCALNCSTRILGIIDGCVLPRDCADWYFSLALHSQILKTYGTRFLFICTALKLPRLFEAELETFFSRRIICYGIFLNISHLRSCLTLKLVSKKHSTISF